MLLGRTAAAQLRKGLPRLAHSHMRIARRCAVFGLCSACAPPHRVALVSEPGGVAGFRLCSPPEAAQEGPESVPSVLRPPPLAVSRPAPFSGVRRQRWARTTQTRPRKLRRRIPPCLFLSPSFSCAHALALALALTRSPARACSLPRSLLLLPTCTAAQTLRTLDRTAPLTLSLSHSHTLSAPLVSAQPEARNSPRAPSPRDSALSAHSPFQHSLLLAQQRARASAPQASARAARAAAAARVVKWPRRQ
jgi:hypothetical protein